MYYRQRTAPHAQQQNQTQPTKQNPAVFSHKAVAMSAGFQEHVSHILISLGNFTNAA